ncbi:MAG: hypothetical protein A3K19_01210 [Lentisphaerae bacterium RIFOXYB12_FULL_65_16]|nr:MAG: hypothetical protein A3K18_33770 [Lentisphaerae bacterium RIFOXYA12_64_32]OGV92509.1 MAG: hypothetical protein A3K19_01210 [Lentisphaerae bacterium RIFOXYB12_FULL_65_16]
MWFLIAVVNHMLFPFIFACGAFALALASFCGTLVALSGVSVRRGPVGDAATGQTVAMPLLVKNELDRPRQPLVVLEHCPFALEQPTRTVVESLDAAEERVVQRRILAMHRGEFELSRIFLRSGDPAGLFCQQRSFRCPKKMVVVPGTEPLPDLRPSLRYSILTTVGSPVSAAGISQDFYGVREYNPTDGLRHIHWKSSARFHHLMVQEYERNAVMSVAVLLDADERHVSSRDIGSNLEYQIRAAASICTHMAGLYCSLSFAAGGQSMTLMPTRLATQALQEILLQLAVLKAGPIPVDRVAYDLAMRLPRNTVVYCLTLDTADPARDALRVLEQQGMGVRWFCAPPEAFPPLRPMPDPAAPAAEVAPRRRVSGPTQPSLLHRGMGLARALTGD